MESQGEATQRDLESEPEPPGEAEVLPVRLSALVDQADSDADPEQTDAIMSLFDAASDRHYMSTPDALKDAFPQVSIEDLLAEARTVRGLLAGQQPSSSPMK